MSESRAYLSKIQVPDGTTYYLKDEEARQAIAGGVTFIGVTTTTLTDGATTNPITIDNQSVTVVSGDLVVAGTTKKEFLFDGTKWIELGGDLSGLGNLAFADTASTSYTPAGTITPNLSGSFSGSSLTSTGKFTPSGSVTLTTASTSSTVAVTTAESGEATYTPAGSISGSFTGSSSNVTITASDNTSGNYQPKGSVSSTFTGTSMTSTGTYTPSGSVSVSTNATSNKTATVSPAESGAATYTPSGSVAAPTISVSSAGSTSTIHNPSSKTVTTSVAVAAPGATAPSNNLTYYSVSNETLSLYQLGYNTGASITTSDVTVKTGDASYTATAPAFTGTGVRLVTGNIPVPSSYTASFSGTEGNVSVSGTTDGSVSSTFTGTKAQLGGTVTPSGSISATFLGTGARLVTSVPDTPTASFSGTEGNVSVSGTPSGSVTISGTPTFSGTAATIQVTPDS